MNCNEFEQRLADFTAGILSGSEKRMMDAHRAGCKSCARLAAMQKMLDSSLNNTERVAAPKGFAERILATVGEGHSPAATAESALSCETFERLVVDYTDGVLPKQRMAAMTAHREECTSCNALAKAHRAVVLAFDSAEPVTAPAALTQSIETAAAQHEHVVKSARFWERFGIAAAAVAAFGSLAAFSSRLTGWITTLTGDYSGLTNVVGNLRTYLLGKAAPYAAAVTSASTGYASKLQSMATTPVPVPYIGISIAPYYIAAALCLAAYMWYYFEDSGDFTNESAHF